MTRPIKRTLARTAAVERVPIRYPVIWAHDETQVTPWDPVCGGNPMAEFPQPEEEIERGGIGSSAHLLGGGGQPPPSRFTFAVSYPRLTRRTPYTPRDKPPKLGPKDKTCQDISVLLKYEKNEKQLKKQVLSVANKYGPLRPGRNTSQEWDTLQAWIKAARSMRFYLDLVKSVKEHSEPLEGFSRKVREDEEREERHRLVESAPPEMCGLISDFTDVGPFGYKKPMVDLPLSEYREKLASHFWGYFSMFASGDGGVELSRTPGQTRVACGSFAWAYKELWELLTSKQHVLLCHRCHTPFVATRNDALTCSGACEKALQRRRSE